MSVDKPSVEFARVTNAMRDVLRVAAPSTGAVAALTVAIESATESIDPDELARRCGRSARSLRRDLQTSGLPPPGALIAWGKLLVAIALLDDKAVSVERAALTIGLSGSAALVHLCRRHLGPTPGEVRLHGGLTAAKEIFQARIAVKLVESRQ